MQGTGNGHVARARQIIPILQKYFDVDVYLGGNQSEVSLPIKPKYASRGLVMIYNQNGGVSIWKTLIKNNYFQLLRDIYNAPVRNYDLVINDFEFVTAHASKYRKVKCIQISHQAAFLSPKSPRPVNKQWWGELILKHYAPASTAIGFHFENYDDFIFPPVIRNDIRNAVPNKNNHITVYLPAFHHEILVKYFQEIKEVNWHIFSKSCQKSIQQKHITIQPINNEAFVKSFVSGVGVICGAGFEAPAEAIFLGKKLMVIPIAGQYEQMCNAAALANMGITVIEKLDESFPRKIKDWLYKKENKAICYPDYIELLLKNLDNDIKMAEILRSNSQYSME